MKFPRSLVGNTQGPPPLGDPNPYSSPSVQSESGNDPSWDIGRCFNDAIEVYRRNWLMLALAAFLFEILSIFSLTILMGPLAGGMSLMMLNAMRREDKMIELGDLFGAFDRFGTLLGLFYLTFLPILFGFVLCVIPGLLLCTIWLFPFYLVVDKKLGVFDAMYVSQQIVSRKGFGMNLLLVVISLAISIGSGSIPYLGVVLSWFISPIAWLIETSAYIQQVDEDQGALADLLSTTNS